jgi:hypothetical protein
LGQRTYPPRGIIDGSAEIPLRSTGCGAYSIVEVIRRTQENEVGNSIVFNVIEPSLAHRVWGKPQTLVLTIMPNTEFSHVGHDVLRGVKYIKPVIGSPSLRK